MAPLELPLLTIADATAWSHWLTRHAASSPGVWLTLSKKPAKDCPHQPVTSLIYAQALDEALCQGWIDGQTRRHAEPASTSNTHAAALFQTSYTQRFTPRAKRSGWSARNVGYIARLEAEGRMRDRGREEVERAKADGRWDAAYSGSKDAVMPEVFEEALKRAGPKVQRAWEALGKGQRYGYYHRLATLRTEKGKEKKVKEFMAALAGDQEEGEGTKGEEEVEGQDGEDAVVTTAKSKGQKGKLERKRETSSSLPRTTSGPGGISKSKAVRASPSVQQSLTDSKRRRSARIHQRVA